MESKVSALSCKAGRIGEPAEVLQVLSKKFLILGLSCMADLAASCLSLFGSDRNLQGRPSGSIAHSALNSLESCLSSA